MTARKKHLLRTADGAPEAVMLLLWNGVRIMRGPPSPDGPQGHFEKLDLTGDAADAEFERRLQALLGEGFVEVTEEEANRAARPAPARDVAFQPWTPPRWTDAQRANLASTHFDAVDWWRRVEDWMRRSHVGGVGAFCLGPPASATAIDELEALVGFELPADLRALYEVHDGQTDDEAPAFLPFGVLLPVAQIGRLWRVEHEGRHLPDAFAETYVGDRIRRVVNHPGWIPLTRSPSASESMILDFVPGPGGTCGQVLSPVDEVSYVVVGTSLGHFCGRYLALLEGDQVDIESDDDGWVLEVDDELLRIHDETPYD
jgi:cell wall assembly regulator SMI1